MSEDVDVNDLALRAVMSARVRNCSMEKRVELLLKALDYVPQIAEELSQDLVSALSLCHAQASFVPPTLTEPNPLTTRTPIGTRWWCIDQHCCNLVSNCTEISGNIAVESQPNPQSGGTILHCKILSTRTRVLQKGYLMPR